MEASHCEKFYISSCYDWAGEGFRLEEPDTGWRSFAQMPLISHRESAVSFIFKFALLWHSEELELKHGVCPETSLLE